LQWLIDPGAFDMDAAGDLALEMLIGSLERSPLRPEADG
jgi:hypothetical protein